MGGGGALSQNKVINILCGANEVYMTELLNQKDVASNSNDYLRWECYECWFAFSEIKKGAALALKKIIPVVANGLAKKMV